MKPHARIDPVGRVCMICGRGQRPRLGGCIGAGPQLRVLGYEFSTRREGEEQLPDDTLGFAHLACLRRKQQEAAQAIRGRLRVTDALLALHADRTSELYNKDGTQHTGANIRCAFWQGYNGTPNRWPAKTMATEAWRAGREARKLDNREGRVLVMPQPTRTVARSQR